MVLRGSNDATPILTSENKTQSNPDQTEEETKENIKTFNRFLF
jgi:hypothetical protein